MERHYGSKYDSVKGGVKEIAKAYREDVKAAKKAGDLPKGLKVSVRIDRFSGGSAIDVTVKDPGLVALNPAHFRHMEANPYDNLNDAPCRFTEEGDKLINALEGMLEAYNHDGSDPMTDYFDVRFYSRVSYDYDLEREARESALAEPAADAPKVSAALVEAAAADKTDKTEKRESREKATEEDRLARLAKRASKPSASDITLGRDFSLLMLEVRGADTFTVN